MDTPTEVAKKVLDDFPAAIVTLAGTATDELELAREMEIPPEGAAWLRVTVPVALVPPVRAAGLKLRPERAALLRRKDG